MLLNNNKEYIYPNYWNDEDICKFKYYLKQSKEMFDLPDDMIELCVERQINEEKGLIKPINYDEVEKLGISTPFFEEFKTEVN